MDCEDEFDGEVLRGTSVLHVLSEWNGVIVKFLFLACFNSDNNYAGVSQRG